MRGIRSASGIWRGEQRRLGQRQRGGVGEGVGVLRMDEQDRGREETGMGIFFCVRIWGVGLEGVERRGRGVGYTKTR